MQVPTGDSWTELWFFSVSYMKKFINMYSWSALSKFRANLRKSENQKPVANPKATFRH
jgi:hypothetical protein